MSPFYQLGLVQLTKCGKIIATGQGLRKIGVRWIATKDTLLSKPPLPKKPAPYPYLTKKYGFLQMIYDDTLKRLDENSKVMRHFNNLALSHTHLSLCCIYYHKLKNFKLRFFKTLH